MNGTSSESQAGATGESLLSLITQLYEGGQGGQMGLTQVAELVGLGSTVRRPRRKVSVMIVGNHSAGKSSFINWYIGERVVKTGVAIETRGFILCTSGRKRETLTGDATLRYFDYLAGFDSFEGLLPNLFTEISTSKERSFAAVDFVDTPGLVDGDMKYPFDVKDSIMWMADHTDLILVFFDPIGQATCRRTLEVVEELNRSAKHLEKIHYFMSKADEVPDERDRQRVLIQITQNLATRIRNSHAFNLPTFYLPHDDDGGLPCAIPNAVEDVCGEIVKAVHQTVQKTLRQLKADCSALEGAMQGQLAADAANRVINSRKTLQGLALGGAALGVLALLAWALSARAAGALCSSSGDGFGDEFGGSSSSSGGGVCGSGLAQQLVGWDAALEGAFSVLVGGLLVALLGAGGGAGWAWRPAPVLDKRGHKKLEEAQAAVARAKRRADALWEEFFACLANAGDR